MSELEFTAKCFVCGNKLEAEVSLPRDYIGPPVISVEPCKTCLGNEYEDKVEDLNIKLNKIRDIVDE